MIPGDDIEPFFFGKKYRNNDTNKNSTYSAGLSMVQEVYEGTIEAEEHALLSVILIFSGINERKIQRV